MNPEIKTFTGKFFAPLNPRIEDIDIVDIAHALSMTCRFTGHCNQFLSVGTHSILVAKLCPNYPLHGLLHDATEAYLPDIARPIKPFFQDFDIWESQIMELVSKKFGIEWSDEAYAEVKRADTAQLYAEAHWLFETGYSDWPTKYNGTNALLDVAKEQTREMIGTSYHTPKVRKEFIDSFTVFTELYGIMES